MRLYAMIVVAVTLVGLATVFLATPARDGVQALLGPPDAPIGLEPVPGAQHEPFEAPSLTAEEIARAKEALASDPRANALLKGQDYSFRNMTPAIDSDSGSNELIGVAMLISLDRPISANGTWLLKHDAGPRDPEGSGPKEVPVSFSDCAAPNGVSVVMVFFDFASDKLVQFEPLGVPGFDIGTKYCQGGPQ